MMYDRIIGMMIAGTVDCVKPKVGFSVAHSRVVIDDESHAPHVDSGVGWLLCCQVLPILFIPARCILVDAAPHVTAVEKNVPAFARSRIVSDQIDKSSWNINAGVLESLRYRDR